jgi:CRISPR-associated protein Csb2
MFAVGVDFLSGRYSATAYNDREIAEWPPQPARLFSALVATWADGEPSSGQGEAELQALRWLERQAPPDVVGSAQADVGIRDVVPVFVPVNDVGVISMPETAKLADAEAALHAGIADPKARARAEREVEKLRAKLVVDTAKATMSPSRVSGSDLVAAAQIFPERRLRQPRTFPSVTPAVPTAVFVWPTAAPPEEQRVALRGLLTRLVRLGHSSSFVHARLMDAPTVAALESQTARFVPDLDRGDLVFRWVAPGQVDRLIAAHARHRETEPRVLPATFVRYREGGMVLEAKVDTSIFGDDWIVLARVSGPRLPSTAAAGVARQLRRVLMSFSSQPVPEMLSGHHPDGPASVSPHLAVVPLPFVGSEHADGALLGFGLVLPRAAQPAERLAILEAVHRFEAKQQSIPGGDEVPILPLHLGSAGVLNLQRVVWGEHESTTLRAQTWSGPSRKWASATPVALDRNPGDLHDPDPEKRRAAFDVAKADVLEGIARVGLPTPIEVDVVRSCVLPGSAKPRLFPRFPLDASRTQRVLVHVRVLFREPVRGPILLGAGRYQGLGLLRPVDGKEWVRS